MITPEQALAIYRAGPEAVVKEGLFKERLTALVTYMKAVDHASCSTIRKFVRDVMGEKVSRGYLRKADAKASTALDAPPPCYPPWADSPGVPAAGTPG